MAKKPAKEMDIARKIWLAGIGAYGKAIGDATEAYAKMGRETTKVFEDLVGKGAELEGKVSTAATTAAMRYAPDVEKQRALVEDRMERMKAALGMSEVAADQKDQMEGIEARLDAIEAKLDELIALSKPKKPAPRARKAPAKKTPAKK